MDSLFSSEDSIASFSEAIERPSEFPYTWSFARTDAALLYRYLVQNRRVHEGDVFDADRLVCLADLEGLVTDDQGLREICDLVWGAERTTITFKELESRLG